MKRYIREAIWFTGSKKHEIRTIYKDDEKYFIKWYGEMIGVHKMYGSWMTVEKY